MTRRVIVVGGTSGIGRAIAEGFAAAGDTVTAFGHEAVTEPVQGITFGTLDVGDPGAVAAIFKDETQIDVLVNAAGIIKRGGLEFTSAGFEEVIDINLTGTHRCCLAAHHALTAGGGTIINIASMLTYFGSAVSPAYAASKGGIGQLTKSLALAWATDGIRVNALAPGWISTSLTAALGADDARSTAIVARTPAGRWGQPQDLVGPAMFLASQGAAFVTGAIIPVDGGYSAR